MRREVYHGSGYADVIRQVLDGDRTWNWMEWMAEETAGLREVLDRSEDVVLGWKTRRYALTIGAKHGEALLFQMDGRWMEVLCESVQTVELTSDLPLQCVTAVDADPVSLSKGEAEIAMTFAARLGVLMGAAALRQALSLHEACLTYAKKRHTFGVPIAKHQMVMDALVVAQSELDGNRLFLMEAANDLSEGCADAHRLVRETGFLLGDLPLLVDRELPVLGAYGLTEDAGVLDFFTRVHHLALIGGTSHGEV